MTIRIKHHPTIDYAVVQRNKEQPNLAEYKFEIEPKTS